MKKLTNLPFGSREEYFLSDIYSQGKVLAKGIKSKLIRNDIKYSRALLLLYVPNEDIRKIRIHSEFEIKGYSENMASEKIGEIHIPKGYKINATTFSSLWNESVVEIIPDEIYQIHYFPGQNETKKEKQNILFVLTYNKMVEPFKNIEMSSTGDMNIKLETTVILKLKNDWEARFEEYRYCVNTKIEEVDGTFSTSHLALNLEKDNHSLASANEVKILSDMLDTLLWYLSFGSRQRTTWIKWTAEIGTELVEHYRNNIFIPEKIKYYEEPLIDRRAFQDFLQHCLEYEKQQNNLDLYLPIVYLVSSGNPTKTMEMQFLSSFLALEALLDLYAESRNINKHFTKKDRKPLKEIYNDFCSNMKIDNTDLWPIYGTRFNYLSLSRIRNKLVHGNRFEYETFLSIANEHLRWTVERCLLAVLGWKGITNVKPESLRKYTAYHNWESYYKNE